MKKTHLSLDDRITIVHMLSEQCSFKQIALAVGKNCTSISREVRNHILFRKTGGVKIVPTAPSALRVFPRIENAVPSVTSAMPIVRTFSRSPAAGS